MSTIDVLRTEYPGDAAWKVFVDAFRPAWKTYSDKQSAVTTLGDQEIAIVLSSSFGAKAIDWFSNPCKPLGGRTPSDVFTNERHGDKIIRTLLMRMPR